MKTILLTLILIFPLFLSAKWEEVESPKIFTQINNINSGKDFLVGSSVDIYFSFDKGETWEKRMNGFPLNINSVGKIEVENELIVVSTNFSTEFPRQYIMYSIDKGQNWRSLTEKLDSNMIVIDFEISDGTVYLRPAQTYYLLKTSDFGETWDSSITWQNIKITPSLFDINNDTIILAENGGITQSGDDVPGKLFVSTNLGKSWEARHKGFEVKSMNILKVKEGKIYIGGQKGFIYSEDYGISWKQPLNSTLNSEIYDIDFQNDTAYVSTMYGLFRAKDLYNGWQAIPIFNGKRILNTHITFNKLFVTMCNYNWTNYQSVYSSQNNINSYAILNFYKNDKLSYFQIDFPKIYFTGTNIYSKNNLEMNSERLLNSDTLYGFRGPTAYKNTIAFTYLYRTANSMGNTILYSKDKGKNLEKVQVEFENNFYKIDDCLLINEDSVLIITKEKGLFFSQNFKEELNRINTENDTLNNLLRKIKSIYKRNNSIFYIGKGIILESDTNLRNWVNYPNNFIKNMEILSFTKNKNNLYLVTTYGGNNVMMSHDNGQNWTLIKDKFQKYNNFLPQTVFVVDNYVFLSSQNGLFLSRDNGETWEEINEGVNSNTRFNGGEFHLYGDKILFCSAKGIYYRELSDLGIYLSVETTEDRNYLWTNPPYPQPSNNQVKVEVYWDSNLPFTSEDVEIYNLTGIKINTFDQLNIIKESTWKGNIIWDASNQNPGIYIMKITHGTETRTRKILITE